MYGKQDYITPLTAHNLSELFYERVNRSSERVAYRYFDNNEQQWCDLTWQDISEKVRLWHTAFRHEGLVKGDRVAIMMRNSPEWVVFDQAAYSLGLVVVPIYTNDRPDNIRYILEDANVKVFLLEDPEHCKQLISENLADTSQFSDLLRVLTFSNISEFNLKRLSNIDNWLPSYAETIQCVDLNENDLATIVYTSGTTGRPKGVMLSHKNIFSNAHAAASVEHFDNEDVFLSFLPMSHMFERTAGYYMPMICGAKVAYARSIELLGEDLVNIKPTVLVTVPRIFERVYNKIFDQLSQKSPIALVLFKQAVKVGWHRFLYQQKRETWHPRLLFWPILKKLVAGKILAKLGGNLQLAVSGGAALSPEIAKTFIGLGLTISQGYGLTETSPVVCTNKLADNDPFSVGQTLNGVKVKLGVNDELMVQAPSVMQGYWKNEAATKEVITEDGWFHTGDKAKIEGEHIYITGRIKEIIVLSNGEKVPPSDIELAIATESLFEQVIVIGEAKPFLSAIITLNEDNWKKFISKQNISNNSNALEMKSIQEILLELINNKLSAFPGYAKIIRAHYVLKPWEIESGLITPTLKLKRTEIFKQYSDEIEELYVGH
ncbi:MAG: long-chain fatty acid--CoA ligase [Woeseiaceae bacterium]